MQCEEKCINTKIWIFQSRGRPQGNGDKTDLRLFPKPVLRSGEQAKTTRHVGIEIAMDLCIDEQDEERESEAQSVVRATKRARPPPLPRTNEVLQSVFLGGNPKRDDAPALSFS